MPSNQLIESVAPHLIASGEAYKTAVASTVQQVQRLLADHRDSQADRNENHNAELGALGAARINIDKFSALVSRDETLDLAMLEVIDRSLTVLEVVENMLEDVLQIDVPTGTRTADAVRDAFTQIGLAFGAARAVHLARNGGHTEGQHHDLLDGIPFRKWTKSERMLAPPLLLEVDGEDLSAASLAEFMDGNVKLVIVPRTPTAPAQLVRLITPRTFVLQTRDPAALDSFANWNGPGIAMVSEDCARFVHNPDGGPKLSDRLTAEILPANPKQSLGGISVRQQLEELEQLRVLTSPHHMPVTAAEAEASGHELPPDPADKLAAWLMNQARDISAV